MTPSIGEAGHELSERGAGQGGRRVRGAEEGAEGGGELARGRGPEHRGRKAEETEAGGHHVVPGKGSGAARPSADAEFGETVPNLTGRPRSPPPPPPTPPRKGEGGPMGTFGSGPPKVAPR